MTSIAHAVAIAVLGVVLVRDARADVTVDSSADVDVADAQCTLREAIVAVNADASYHGCTRTVATIDTIAFALGSGTPTITVTGSDLPALTGPTIIDGATGGATRVEIAGTAGRGTGMSFLGATDASGSIVCHLVINGFAQRQLLLSNGSNFVVEDDRLGVDPGGVSSKGSGGAGLEICQGGACGVCEASMIGGKMPTQRNVIVGIGAPALVLDGSGANLVQGNRLGTNAAGTARLSDAVAVAIRNADGNVIGGTQAGEGNLIAGQGGVDVGGDTMLARSDATSITGNLIGTDVTGTVALGAADGITLSHASNTVIGGGTPGAGNVVSGNATGIGGGAGGSVLVEGNWIGTDASGTVALGNTGRGVDLGGDAVIRGNVIAFNGLDGIQVDCATCVQRITANAIHANGGLGIDLDFGHDYVTDNDSGDADAGPNGLQNFPVLPFAVFAGGASVSGVTLSSTPATTFRVEVFASDACDDSGYGEGQELVGANDAVTTDGNGDALFSVSFTKTVPFGQVLTAIAIAPGGSTSEFAPCTQTPTSTTTTTSITTTSTTTTSSSTTALPTTTATTTSVPTTSLGPTTSTAVSTTTTSSSQPGTTTTTQPEGGCDPSADPATFAAIRCHLTALRDRIGGEPGLGTLAAKLGRFVDKAAVKVADAEGLCRAADAKKARKRLQPAIGAMSGYGRRLASRAAQKIDPVIRARFVADGGALLSALQSRRSALACPADAPPG